MVEIILTAHLLVILFFIVGFPLGLVYNRRGFRLFHAGALGLIVLLMVLRIPCPLTVIEEDLSGGSYQGSFIAFWLNRIIYVEWFDPKNVLIADLCILVLVFSSFYWYPLPKKNASRDSAEIPPAKIPE